MAVCRVAFRVLCHFKARNCSQSSLHLQNGYFLPCLTGKLVSSSHTRLFLSQPQTPPRNTSRHRQHVVRLQNFHLAQPIKQKLAWLWMFTS